MTLAAINNFVLTLKGKPGTIVVEENGICGYGPAVSGMASVTTYFEILSMGGLGIAINHGNHHYNSTQNPLNTIHLFLY
jgi:hypothetical protein